jgi:hypothetical protein
MHTSKHTQNEANAMQTSKNTQNEANAMPTSAHTSASNDMLKSKQYIQYTVYTSTAFTVTVLYTQYTVIYSIYN